jgi:predicted O-methyltransferase YrrM
MTIDITRAQQIEGWMADSELLWLAEQASQHQKIVEIGSWKGRSTRALADNTSGIVYAVDTWKGSDETRELLTGRPEQWLVNEFWHNMVGVENNVRAVQATSLDAAEMFQGVKLDMVFIDAAHDYESVKSDILAWLPLLVSGGLFCGHDYQRNWPGVMQAVDEVFPQRKVISDGSIWYTDETREQNYSEFVDWHQAHDDGEVKHPILHR